MRGIGASARAYAKAWAFAAAAGATGRAAVPEELVLSDDGEVPNSPLPTLIYRGVPLSIDKASALERMFRANGWPPRWRYTVYDFHHYHSDAHEALGVAAGTARLQLGGQAGRIVTVRAGDVVVIPAGTAHRRVEASADFLVVGAYPEGTGDFDLLRPDPVARDAALRRIGYVPPPRTDPVLGSGGLVKRWR